MTKRNKIIWSKSTIGSALLLGFAILSVIGSFFIPSLPQELSYHSFSDQLSCCAIPNIWNVLSNIPFLIVGLLGLKNIKNSSEFHFQKRIFFTGVALVAFGSSYYHWNPNNETLLWDRLPMTIAFMALFSLILGEFVNGKLGKYTLIPLLLVGGSSVLYWKVYDDLRFYAMVQFYPLVTIPIMLLLFKQKTKTTWGYWLLILSYVLAKFCEHFDTEIHDVLYYVSGHSLKHLIAALGVYFLSCYFKLNKSHGKFH